MKRLLLCCSALLLLLFLVSCSQSAQSLSGQVVAVTETALTLAVSDEAGTSGEMPDGSRPEDAPEGTQGEMPSGQPEDFSGGAQGQMPSGIPEGFTEGEQGNMPEGGGIPEGFPEGGQGGIPALELTGEEKTFSFTADTIIYVQNNENLNEGSWQDLSAGSLVEVVVSKDELVSVTVFQTMPISTQ